METTTVNSMRSDSDSEHKEDKIVPKEENDLETIKSQENENSKAHGDLQTCDDGLVDKENKESSEKLENEESLEKSLTALIEHSHEYGTTQEENKLTQEEKTHLVKKTVPENNGSVSTAIGGDLGKDGPIADAEKLMKITENEPSTSRVENFKYEIQEGTVKHVREEINESKIKVPTSYLPHDDLDKDDDAAEAHKPKESPRIEPDELKHLLDNTGNLQLNSTIERENRASTEPIKPETNTENVKSALKIEGSGTSPTNVAVNGLTPLRFHRVHGQFIKISMDYCTAHSAIPKDKPFLVTHESFAFSSRPVAINEKVYLCLETVSRPYHDPFGFGFTDCDPNIVADFMPRLCRFKTCIFGNCLNYLPNNFGKKGNTLYFFVKPSGQVCYGINDQDMGCLPIVININTPLWAIIKLSRDVSVVKFIEFSKENETEDLKSSNVEKASASKENIESRENQNTDIILKSPAPANGPSAEKPGLFSSRTPVNDASQRNVRDLRFHSVHGKFVKMSFDHSTVKCEMPSIEPFGTTHECYAFSSRPVDINEKVYLKLETDIVREKKYLNGFSFGFTDYDPGIIPDVMNRLCPRSPCIFGTSLISLENKYCEKDNYLHFYVNKSGEIHFGINNEEKDVCFRMNTTSSRVWVVIKVTNHVSSVTLERTKPDFQSSASPAKIAGEVSSPKKNSSVENAVERGPKFSKTELKTTAQTSREVLNPSTVLPSTSNTPAKQIQSTSSADIEKNQEFYDKDVSYFAKIVQYQLCRIPEHKKIRCMRNILEVIDNISK